MKKFLLVLGVVFFLVGTQQAVSQVIGIQGGIQVSDFEDQETPSNGVGLGVSIGFNPIPMIETGVEYQMLLTPFTDELEAFGAKYTNEISQNLLGAYVRVKLPLVIINPYAKVGAGMYMGKMKQTVEVGGDKETDEADFKSAFGFNAAVGMEFLLGIYAEAAYHMVDRQLDVEGAEAFGANNIAVNVGWRFGF